MNDFCVGGDSMLPWGLRRAAPFASTAALPYVWVELDPVSQMA